MLIGFGKSGSTTLAGLLNAHPKLSYGARKEHLYFGKTSGGQLRARPPPASWDAYLDEFVVGCGKARTFDATPNYVRMGHRNASDAGGRRGMEAVQHVKDTLGPNLQLLVLIRDPVDAVCSRTPEQCTYERLRGSVDCYPEFLESWVRVFSASQIMFIKSEDLFLNQRQTVRRILSFVGVEDFEDSFYASRLHKSVSHMGGNGSSGTSALPEGARRSYHSAPRARRCKQKLEALTGLSFAWDGS